MRVVQRLVRLLRPRAPPAHYLVRNIASLFGIPSSRMKIPEIVAGSTVLKLQIEAAAACR